jgi:putative oxidoreductase
MRMAGREACGMSAIGSATPASVVRDAAPPGSAVPFPSRWLGFAVTYVRVTLAAAFLSAVASRFGLWTGEPWSGAFQRFVGYTAEVNSFLPTAAASFLAWSATAAETVLGVALLLGVQRRAVAFASAVLLAIFGGAMAISFGPKAPLDYSVFTASAAALLLAVQEGGERAWAARRRPGRPAGGRK